MECIYTELALYSSNNECVRADNVFPPISEICDGTVSLRVVYLLLSMKDIWCKKMQGIDSLNFVT